MIRVRVCGLNDDYTEIVQVVEEWLNDNDIEYDGFDVKEWYGDETVYDTLYKINSKDVALYQTIVKALEGIDVRIEIFPISKHLKK